MSSRAEHYRQAEYCLAVAEEVFDPSIRVSF